MVVSWLHRDPNQKCFPSLDYDIRVSKHVSAPSFKVNLLVCQAKIVSLKIIYINKTISRLIAQPSSNGHTIWGIIVHKWYRTSYMPIKTFKVLFKYNSDTYLSKHL